MPREFYVATDQDGDQLVFEHASELMDWLGRAEGRTIVRIEKL